MAKYSIKESGIWREKQSIGSSAGAGDAEKLIHLDTGGKLDESFMPTGIGADTQVVVASEDINANENVNVWSDGGAFKIRKADATTEGKEAHGFLKSSVLSGGNGTVYFKGTNSGLSGLTPGRVYQSTTPGQTTNTPPSGSGNVVQCIGTATSATSMNFEPGEPYTLV